MGSNLFFRSSIFFFLLPLKVVFHQRLSSTEVHLPPKIGFQQRLSSIKGRFPFPPKDVFHRRSSFTKDHLPPKVVFTKGHLPQMVVVHRRSSSAEGCLLLKVLFHRWWSPTEGRLPPTITPCLILYLKNSQHTKSQPPTLLRSGLKFVTKFLANTDRHTHGK